MTPGWHADRRRHGAFDTTRLIRQDYRAAAGDEMTDMFVWFDEGGYDVDIDALRTDYGIETRDLAASLADSEVWAPVGTPTN